jgi:hypothetical protein
MLAALWLAVRPAATGTVRGPFPFSTNYRISEEAIESRIEADPTIVVVRVSGHLRPPSGQTELSLRLLRGPPDRRARGPLTGDDLDLSGSRVSRLAATCGPARRTVFEKAARF